MDDEKSGVRSLSIGGVSASHAAPRTQTGLMAPTMGKDFNTIRVALIPIACWRLEDLRFDFDSSFVKPAAKEEFQHLINLIEAHRKYETTPPLSVFGHADPSGDDDYNKKLSGRRAMAVYGVLTRDTELWEELYSHPLGGDNWGKQRLQTMVSFTTGQQSRSDQKPDIKQYQNDKMKRKALFLAYMDALCIAEDELPYKLDKTAFIAQGKDPQGKGDYQGCGEFNPLMLFSQEEEKNFSKPENKETRNAQNALNRRVLVLLYRPGAKVDPGHWPCSRAKEGTAACKKRFWSDGEKRRKNRLPDKRQFYGETHHTFACRFYQCRIDTSPCEQLFKFPTPVIHFLGPDKKALDPEAASLGFGLFDHAHDHQPGDGDFTDPIFNEMDEPNNFVGADSRRFYVRVRLVDAPNVFVLPDGRRTIQVDWFTTTGGGAEYDDNYNAPSITLVESDPVNSPHEYISMGLMLVTNSADRGLPTHCGIPGVYTSEPQRGLGATDHRVRLADIFSKAVVEYPPRNERSGEIKVARLQANVFQPARRLSLPMRVFLLRSSAVSPPCMTPDDFFMFVMAKMHSIYSKLGIQAETIEDPTADDQILKGDTRIEKVVGWNGPCYIIDRSFAGTNVDLKKFSETDMLQLCKTFPQDGKTIRVFIAEGVLGDQGHPCNGLSWPDRDHPQDARLGACVTVPDQNPGKAIVAHEIGHLLTNKPTRFGTIADMTNNALNSGGGHYTRPAVPPDNRYIHFYNLMGGTRFRLYDVDVEEQAEGETVTFNQYRDILNNSQHYLYPMAK